LGGLRTRQVVPDLFLFFDGVPAPIAIDSRLQDCCVMSDPVHGGEGHGWIGENLVPLAGRLVSRDQHGPPIVPDADEFEHERLVE
jgi:hypothetical protein